MLNISSYDLLASVYDALGLGQHSLQLAQVLSILYTKPGRALDLCCGTGLAAQLLAQQGWQVTAVDQSSAMLDIARARARDSMTHIEYILDDARDLDHVHGHFDLITCFGDSLAELEEVADLHECLSTLAQHLKPQGLLAFDMRRKSMYEHWDAYSEVLHDDHALLAYVERDYVARDQLASHRYVWFMREIDLWWREESTIDTRFYDDSALNIALQQAGLHIMSRLNLHGQAAHENEEWVLFLVRLSEKA